MTEKKMEELQILKGYTILLKGKNGRDTVCIALSIENGDNLTNNKIRMNKVVKNNLEIDFGDIISVHPYPDIPDGNHIDISPIDD